MRVMASVRADTYFADQLSPFRRLRGDECRELRGGQGRKSGSFGEKALLNVGGAHGGEDFRIELRGDRGGHSRRPEGADPVVDFESRQRLGERRDFRRGGGGAGGRGPRAPPPAPPPRRPAPGGGCE